MSSQFVYCFFIIDGIEFYNFHKREYQGVFQETLQFLDFIEDNVWSIIPSEQLLHFLNEPFDLPNYNAFTNPRFLEKKRMSSLFWQNTKKYFCVALPFSVLYFIILNRLFHLLKSYKVSSLIRIFALWLQLGLMLAVQNISLLNYFFLQNISTLFSLDTESRTLNLLTLLLYGVFIVFCCSFLPLVSFLYGQSAVHFMNNSRLVPGSLFFCFLRGTLRPLCEGFIHIFLFENQPLQLTLLGTSALLSLLSALVF